LKQFHGRRLKQIRLPMGGVVQPLCLIRKAKGRCRLRCNRDVLRNRDIVGKSGRLDGPGKLRKQAQVGGRRSHANSSSELRFANSTAALRDSDPIQLVWMVKEIDRLQRTKTKATPLNHHRRPLG
jgi:hypothetical protein